MNKIDLGDKPFIILPKDIKDLTKITKKTKLIQCYISTDTKFLKVEYLSLKKDKITDMDKATIEETLIVPLYEYNYINYQRLLVDKKNTFEVKINTKELLQATSDLKAGISKETPLIRFIFKDNTLVLSTNTEDTEVQSTCKYTSDFKESFGLGLSNVYLQNILKINKQSGFNTLKMFIYKDMQVFDLEDYKRYGFKNYNKSIVSFENSYLYNIIMPLDIL